MSFRFKTKQDLIGKCQTPANCVFSSNPLFDRLLIFVIFSHHYHNLYLKLTLVLLIFWPVSPSPVDDAADSVGFIFLCLFYHFLWLIAFVLILFDLLCTLGRPANVWGHLCLYWCQCWCWIPFHCWCLVWRLSLVGVESDRFCRLFSDNVNWSPCCGVDWISLVIWFKQIFYKIEAYEKIIFELLRPRPSEPGPKT